MKNAAPVLIFGLVGVGAVVLLAAAGGGSPVAGAQRVVRTTMDWADKVIARVSRHEGSYDSLNLNLDGAGLSFGIIQWAQKVGNLGVLLAEMQRTDPQRFAATFGTDWQALLYVTARSSLEPVGGVVLWREPWVSRFKAAGRDPVFIDVQNRLARQGHHFQGALQAAAVFGVWTERALALFYDTAVQQGPAFAKRLAEKVRDEFLAKGLTRIGYHDVLLRYAQLAPAHFRRTSAPTKPYPVSHIEWRKTGDEWHAWAGQFDLYAGITRRRMGIVNDPDLSDEPLPLAVA
jgi:hypothetical protein